MGVLPPSPNFLPFLPFYSTLRQYRVTLSCWESGLLSSPISLFHFQSKSGTLPFPLKKISESDRRQLVLGVRDASFSVSTCRRLLIIISDHPRLFLVWMLVLWIISIIPPATIPRRCDYFLCCTSPFFFVTEKGGMNGSQRPVGALPRQKMRTRVAIPRSEMIEGIRTMHRVEAVSHMVASLF